MSIYARRWVGDCDVDVELRISGKRGDDGYIDSRFSSCVSLPLALTTLLRLDAI